MLACRNFVGNACTDILWLLNACGCRVNLTFLYPVECLSHYSATSELVNVVGGFGIVVGSACINKLIIHTRDGGMGVNGRLERVFSVLNL